MGYRCAVSGYFELEITSDWRVRDIKWMTGKFFSAYPYLIERFGFTMVYLLVREWIRSWLQSEKEYLSVTIFITINHTIATESWQDYIKDGTAIEEKNVSRLCRLVIKHFTFKLNIVNYQLLIL